MPELPEVEVVRAGLERTVAGRVVADVRVLEPRSVRRHAAGPADFEHQLVGRTFGVARRRGKFLWVPFPDGDALVAHLGMSGQLRIDAASAPPRPHTRVIIGFDDDGPQLRFDDQRMFGGLALASGGAELPAAVAHIARDPLDPQFDPDDVVARLRTSRSAVKRVLLDQRVVSGVGNIYADESLWRARLHYATPGRAVSVAQAHRLLDAVRAVLDDAIRAGGTSFDALYVGVDGTSGYFARQLSAYGRTGAPCPRCGTPIVREPFMNRSSFLCPSCQVGS